MKKILFLGAILAVVFFSSCKKDRLPEETSAPKTMEELTVPASFDWKTTKEVNLLLTANASGITEVTNSQNITYQKAFLQPGISYNMKLTVPSYEKSVKLKFQGKEATLEISGTNLTYTFE